MIFNIVYGDWGHIIPCKIKLQFLSTLTLINLKRPSSGYIIRKKLVKLLNTLYCYGL